MEKVIKLIVLTIIVYSCQQKEKEYINEKKVLKMLALNFHQILY